MKNRDTKTLSRRWFEKADNLWLYAKAAFRETGLTAPFCFDCQQVAELYLKGFLVLNGRKPPRTHSLLLLIERCIDLDSGLGRLSEECKFLTKYYIPTRYPSYPFPEYSDEEAGEAKKSVEKIVLVIKKN